MSDASPGPTPFPTAGFPRRAFLAKGGRLIAFAGVGALAAAMEIPSPAWAQDWEALRQKARRGGHGKVKGLKGSAQSAGRALAVGGRVQSGETIEVAPDSHLILLLSDNTCLRVNADTRFVLEISQNRTGLLRLLVGSLLTVMPRKNRYLVQMPTATVGIKGTVFFHQIYHPGETTALDPIGKKVKIPEGITEYFCLCNGLADFMGAGDLQPFYSDKSAYHNSYYIDPRQPQPMVKAPQLNHTDEEILELIDNQEGSRHDAKFIENYRASYKKPSWLD